MGLIAQRLNLRCFVDGIEVPVIGARCTFAEGAAATAEVQLVATDEIYDIEPRAFVTLFYYETYDYDRVGGKTELKRLSPSDLRRWKLLFAGEYISIVFQKQSGVRAASLICVDHTNYWDFVKQHYVNMSNGGVELIENAFLGVKADRVKTYDVIGVDHVSNLYTWLTKSKGPDGKPNLYLGVQRVLRELWFSSNDFYARSFNRLRVGDMVVGVPEDQTAAKLFQLEFFKKFIENQVGGGGDEVTARMMVENLLGTVFHTYVTIPAPFFDRTGKARGFTPTSDKDPNLSSEMISRELSWPKASLNYTIIKPDTWFVAPPACNIIFPHQYTSLQFQRNHLQEPTRLFMRTMPMFIGTDKWVTERFYSPDFEELNKMLFKKGGYLTRLAETVLAYEEFSGLNPVQTWQADTGAYVQQGARRDYLSRVADYLFWKMRFSTRSVNVSGPFNPNLVPGYPALVMNSVANPGQLTRHYIGNIATVTHVITQSEGGWTHFSATGAHVHDEVVDFDKKGRSLEEVTSRGTDGFIDNRYDVQRIGPEVYQTLFGCGSLADLYELAFGQPDETGVNPLAERLLALEEAGVGEVHRAVEAVHGLYQTAVREGADLEAFVQSLTWRPKANLLEMLGTQFQEATAAGTEIYPVDTSILEKEDSDLAFYEGFFASCTDPDAETTKSAEFTSSVARMIPVTTTTVVPEESIPVGNQQSRLVIRPAQVVTSTTYQAVSAKKKGNYGLTGHLKARRAKVLTYTESLKQRGLRG